MGLIFSAFVFAGILYALNAAGFFKRFCAEFKGGKL